MINNNPPNENKRVLSFTEAAKFLGFAESYLYKLTSAGIVPYSKPNGKKIFFDRIKLEEWMLGNPSTSNDQKEIAASTYIATH